MSAKQDTPDGLKRGNVTRKFGEESQHYEHRKTWRTFNRPTITEVPFHVLPQ